MEYMDQILDRFGHEGDKVFYELYCQNNMSKFSMMTTEDFEEIYYALFDDEITKFLKIEENLEDFKIDDYEEYVNIILTELIASAMDEYSYVRFLAEVPKEMWNDIIKENVEGYQRKTKSQRIFDFYRDKVKLENNK